eukprot:480841_1
MGNKSSANGENLATFDKQQFDLATHTNDVFGLLTIGFLRQNSNKPLKIPPDVQILCLKYYRVSDLIVKKRIKLFCSTAYYLFNSILIKQNGKLTINEWNPVIKQGGTLHIICTGNIILEPNSSIDLNGVGYHGGKGSNMTGESYNAQSIQGSNANIGGGGGGKGRCGGGGGYGTCGKNGDNLHDDGPKPQASDLSIYAGKMYEISGSAAMGKGGKTYGNKKLSILHLGSGGGSVITHNGGCGGGALRIVCFGKIILKKRASIACNGLEGVGNKSGCGSGGSIYIVMNTYENIEMGMNSVIKAI